MRLGAGLAGCILLASASLGVRAADLGHSALPPYGEPPDPARQAIVVPACSERPSAVLMRCAPRREVFDPHDVGLVRIERSLGPPAVLPYKQLFTWP